MSSVEEELRHIWPKRMKIGEFRKVGFAGKAPCLQTLKNQINKYLAGDTGGIPGCRLGNDYYVWVDQFHQLAQPVDSVTVQAVGTGNSLADQILAKEALRKQNGTS